MYFDRPRPGDAQALVGNPPGESGHHRALRAAAEPRQRRLDHVSPPAITVFQYDAKLPTSLQLSAGTQMLLPWATSLDVSYVGLHNWNAQQPWNINSIDLGTAFLPRPRRIRRCAPSTTPGATSLAAPNPDLVRGYRGYSSMASTSRFYDGWRTYHSIQLSINRRFRNGLQFGFNDTITLSDVARVAPRYDHDADGQLVLRADQAEAQELLGNQHDADAHHEGDRRLGAARHRQSSDTALSRRSA